MVILSAQARIDRVDAGFVVSCHMKSTDRPLD